MDDPLKKLLENRMMEPFIRFIRFPKFKNLEPSTEIVFTYPITAILGPNGTNKSSILRALQGCPAQYNIGDHWFSTELDTISGESPEGRNRYIHGYLAPSGIMAQCITTHTSKKDRGDDYWETERPRIKDGMNPMPNPLDPRDAEIAQLSRWRPVSKRVTYIDFRQELPAYDIKMSFDWRKKTQTAEEKKNDIRRLSARVKQALDRLEDSSTYYNTERIMEPAKELTQAELDAVSRIVGREYSRIRIVKHDYFDAIGYTARLETATHGYSEAYAGSGEFAAIMLVHSIMNAEEGSLILLDEPETSLHPAAQRELMAFVKHECKTRRHQVVVATHSRDMVEDLPDEARKLLALNDAGRVFVTTQSAKLSEITQRIGGKIPANTFLVEDSLAKTILERASLLRGTEFKSALNVLAFPGGAQTILKTVPTHALSSTNCTVVLDGDQRPLAPVTPLEDISDAHLEAELEKRGIPSAFIQRNSNDNEINEKYRQVLKWHEMHVRYLPDETNPEASLLLLLAHPLNPFTGEPEALQELVDKARSSHLTDTEQRELQAEVVKLKGEIARTAKKRWLELTRESFNLRDGEPDPPSQDCLTVQRQTLWGLPDESPYIESVADILASAVH